MAEESRSARSRSKRIDPTQHRLSAGGGLVLPTRPSDGDEEEEAEADDGGERLVMPLWERPWDPTEYWLPGGRDESPPPLDF